MVGHRPLQSRNVDSLRQRLSNLGLQEGPRHLGRKQGDQALYSLLFNRGHVMVRLNRERFHVSLLITESQTNRQPQSQWLAYWPKLLTSYIVVVSLVQTDPSQGPRPRYCCTWNVLPVITLSPFSPRKLYSNHNFHYYQQMYLLFHCFIEIHVTPILHLHSMICIFNFHHQHSDHSYYKMFWYLAYKLPNLWMFSIKMHLIVSP